MQQELENTIDNLTKEFEEKIPIEEAERIEIVEAFRENLNFTAKAILECNSMFISKDVNSIKSDLTRKANEFKAKNLEEIKQTLIVDNAFDDIRKKSIEIFNIAKKQLSGSKVKAEIDMKNDVEEMKKLLNDVKEYNQVQAKKFISEAILDLEYITKNNPNCLSLRLYQFEKSAKNRGDER